MQLMKLLHNTFEKQLPCVHKARLNNLMKASETLIRVNKLSLTALGRNLSEKNKPRPLTKRMGFKRAVMQKFKITKHNR